MTSTIVLKAKELARHAQKIATATRCAVVPRPVANPTLVAHGLVKSARWHVLTHEPPRKAIADLYVGTQAEAHRVARVLATLVGEQLEVLNNGAMPAELRDHPRTLASNPSRSKKARARRRGVMSHRQRRSLAKAGFQKSAQTRHLIIGQIRRGMKRGRPHGPASNPKGRNARPTTIREAVADIIAAAKFPLVARDVRSGKKGMVESLEFVGRFVKNERERSIIAKALKLARRVGNPSGCRMALANLALEARHYLNTGRGKQFLSDSIDRASLALTERDANPKGPPLSPALRAQRIASLLKRAQRLFDIGDKAKAQALYTQAWELTEVNPRRRRAPALSRSGPGNVLRRSKRKSGRAGVRRRRNSNPRSAVARAASTFRKWQDRGPIAIRKRTVRAPRALVGAAAELGELVALTYRSDKYDGKVKDHEHVFKQPLAAVVTDPDGKDLHIVRGRSRYAITPDGIRN